MYVQDYIKHINRIWNNSDITAMFKTSIIDLDGSDDALEAFYDKQVLDDLLETIVEKYFN